MKIQSTLFHDLTTMKMIKRIIVAVVGGTVLAAGLALVVLPGPAFVVIPAGLAILAIEFAWAKRWLSKARGYLPGKYSRNKQAGSSSSPPSTNYFRNQEAASCRNLIPSTQNEIPQQAKHHTEKNETLTSIPRSQCSGRLGASRATTPQPVAKVDPH
jgi:hypothetical protein